MYITTCHSFLPYDDVVWTENLKLQSSQWNHNYRLWI